MKDQYLTRDDTSRASGGEGVDPLYIVGAFDKSYIRMQSLG